MPHVLITGASSGLGEVLAVEMGRRGYSVGLLARRRDELERVAGLVRATGAKAALACADVTDPDAVVTAVRAIEAELGPTDILVANAGGGAPNPASKLDVQKVTGLMRLNFDGVVHAVAAVLPAMVARGNGQIAAVSSIAGWRGLPGNGVYSASKAAVTVLLEAYAAELAPHGIAVTTIHPGFVRTPLTAKNKFPMPFLMDADRAARIMANGIERRRLRVDFPFPMVALMSFARQIPVPLWNWLGARFARRTAKPV